MMATLSFLAHWWPWVIVATLAVAGLGYAAFVLKNWRLAAAAAAIVAAWLVTQWFWSAGYKAKADEDLKARTAQLEYRLKLQDKILSDYEEMSKRDDAEIAKLREQVAATPENPTACLPEDAAGRIGEIK